MSCGETKKSKRRSSEEIAEVEMAGRL